MYKILTICNDNGFIERYLAKIGCIVKAMVKKENEPFLKCLDKLFYSQGKIEYVLEPESALADINMIVFDTNTGINIELLMDESINRIVIIGSYDGTLEKFCEETNFYSIVKDSLIPVKILRKK